MATICYTLCVSPVYGTRQAYRDAWEKAYQEDPPVPLNVDVELSSLCNLACKMCYWGDSDFAKSMTLKAWDGSNKKRFMPVEMAIRLIDECAALGVPALKMNFRGESTLNPEFSTILDYARSKSAFHEILVNTNANAPDRAIDGLMYATKVMVSLDSMDPDIYPKIRVNGNLERALEVIGEMRRRNHSNLWVRRVITQLNQDERFIEKVKKHFGADIKVSEHFTFDRNHYAHLALENAYEKWDRVYCGYPSQRIVVTASGVCLPCCVDWSEEIEIGCWPQQSLIQIWNGEPMRRLRQDLRANRLGTAPKICQNCTSYMAYKRPERDWVQDREGKASLA